MQVKRFFAADMRQAMKLVRDELGPDAAILGNRRVAGGIELTAALDYQAPPAPSKPNPALEVELRKTQARIAEARAELTARPAENQRKDRQLFAEEKPARPTLAESMTAAQAKPQAGGQTLEAMRFELNGLRELIEVQLGSIAWGQLQHQRPQQANLWRRLQRMGLPAELSKPLLERVAAVGDTRQAWRMLLAHLSRAVQTPEQDPLDAGGVLALVGPAGAGKTTTLAKMAARYVLKYGAQSLALVSMDNCSHNGDKVKAAVFAYASKWVEQGLVPAEFLAYVKDETKITFPWSMIDKITPRPDAKVQEMLAKDGFEDNYTIVTEKHTFTAPFVNAEETQYLCIEDHYTNGRPPLELGGVLYCDRETVDKIEKMKVCTCLNPLHTAMSIYGCMLGYNLISAEMADEDLRSFIQKIGYIEAMPVVVDPGVLNPYEFIGAVINRRLPNPFMPDAPQRIATDTSQKLAIRFGETIKAYEERGLDKSNLVLIPLVLAGYARYLKGIDDNGQPLSLIHI